VSFAGELKKDRRMRVQFVPEKAKLSLFNPRKRILVENSDEGVIITAAHDNFSEPEKVCLVRYLAAEGFISDDFEDFAKSGGHVSTPVSWTVQQARPMREPSLKCANRFMIRLFISASVLWLLLIIFAFLKAGIEIHT
jgi:hypothetical protein